MKKTIFTGVATAIITPMHEKGVDYATYEKLIEWQIQEGINAIVVAGTTGEGPTLTDEEHKTLIDFTVKQVNGRVPVIAGTGSNDTAYAIELTKFSCDKGADAALLVSPYYNKATQNGLVQSFNAIANCSDLPCILYNVPSRTGCNITPATCKILAQNKNIVAIKEASGNISQIAEVINQTRGDLDVYSGNDDQIVPVLSLGGKGVISVLSNILPRKTVEMTNAFFNGDVKTARDIQIEYLDLINALFSEVNPIPVKSAVAKMGFGQNFLRLPLTPMEKANEDKLFALMVKAGITLK